MSEKKPEPQIHMSECTRSSLDEWFVRKPQWAAFRACSRTIAIDISLAHSKVTDVEQARARR